MTPTAAVDDYRQMFFEMNGEASRSGANCRLWSKYAIYGVNIIFMVVGTLVLATGAWLRTDSRFRDFLSERYRQAVHEAFWEAPTLYAFSYIMILLGAALLLLAMFGCCGVTAGGKRSATTKRRRRRGQVDDNASSSSSAGGVVSTSAPLLWLYTVGSGVLLMFTIGCASYILYTKDGIDVELSDALNYMVQHYYQGPGIVQESLDRLQQAFRCCGNAGCSDFRAFRQDPPRTCDLRCDGCHYRIWLALRIGFSVALAIFGIVILAQIVAISVSLILLCTTDDEEWWDKDTNDNGWAASHKLHHHHHYHPGHNHHAVSNGCHYWGGGGGGGMRSLEPANAYYQRQMASSLSSSPFGQRPPAEIAGNLGTHPSYRQQQQWHRGGLQRNNQHHQFLHNAPSSFHYY